MDKGELVPDEVTNGIVKERYNKPILRKGIYWTVSRTQAQGGT